MAKATKQGRKQNPRKKNQRQGAMKDGELAAIAGGTDVRIGQVTSSVGTTDGGQLSPGIVGKLVGVVTGTIEGIAAAAKRHHYD